MISRSDAKEFYSLWVPIVGALLTQFSFSITDSIMIAPFGGKYLGGIGIAGLYYIITFVFFSGFFDIFSNLYARRLGSIETKENSLLTSLLLVILTSALGSFILLSFSSNFLTFFKQSPEIIAVSSSHLDILSFGVLFSLGYYAATILLRVTGQAKKTFYIVLLGSTLNIIGNWLFLYGPFKDILQPEVAVAWTTIFSRLIMFLALIFSLIRRGTIRFSYFSSPLKPSLKDYFFILKKGAPVGARNLNDWVVSFILVLAIGHFGTSYAAANQATDLISSAIYMLTQAACTTVGIIFSKWIGEKGLENLPKPSIQARIKRLSILSGIPSLIVLFLVIVWREYILDLFSLGSGTLARDMAEIILIIHLISLPIYITQHISNAFLDAFFDTKVPTFFSLMTSYIFVLPLAWYVVFQLSYPPYWVWIIDVLGMFMIASFLAYRVRENINQCDNASLKSAFQTS